MLEGLKRFIPTKWIKPAFCLAVSLGLISAGASAQEGIHYGPLFDESPLTLDAGHRTEIAGPLFHSQIADTEKSWAFPPFFSHAADPAVE